MIAPICGARRAAPSRHHAERVHARQAHRIRSATSAPLLHLLVQLLCAAAAIGSASGQGLRNEQNKTQLAASGAYTELADTFRDQQARAASFKEMFRRQAAASAAAKAAPPAAAGAAPCTGALCGGVARPRAAVPPPKPPPPAAAAAAAAAAAPRPLSLRRPLEWLGALRRLSVAPPMPRQAKRRGGDQHNFHAPSGQTRVRKAAVQPFDDMIAFIGGGRRAATSRHHAERAHARQAYRTRSATSAPLLHLLVQLLCAAAVVGSASGQFGASTGMSGASTGMGGPYTGMGGPYTGMGGPFGMSGTFSGANSMSSGLSASRPYAGMSGAFSASGASTELATTSSDPQARAASFKDTFKRKTAASAAAKAAPPAARAAPCTGALCGSAARPRAAVPPPKPPPPAAAAAAAPRPLSLRRPLEWLGALRRLSVAPPMPRQAKRRGGQGLRNEQNKTQLAASGAYTELATSRDQQAQAANFKEMFKRQAASAAASGVYFELADTFRDQQASAANFKEMSKRQAAAAAAAAAKVAPSAAGAAPCTGALCGSAARPRAAVPPPKPPPPAPAAVAPPPLSLRRPLEWLGALRRLSVAPPMPRQAKRRGGG
ncbi:MAG: hypothetical protein J3K34DRAFT_456396 [Monoraphidium minutum]|nr:MAG: hypothetical protein J3K34DRAFT_456396 [Monoraphidium minutum]